MAKALVWPSVTLRITVRTPACRIIDLDLDVDAHFDDGQERYGGGHQAQQHEDRKQPMPQCILDGRDVDRHAVTVIGDDVLCFWHGCARIGAESGHQDGPGTQRKERAGNEEC